MKEGDSRFLTRCLCAANNNLATSVVWTKMVLLNVASVYQNTNNKTAKLQFCPAMHVIISIKTASLIGWNTMWPVPCVKPKSL